MSTRPEQDGNADVSPHRRSRRVSLTSWRQNHTVIGNITHVDIFLGSLTAVSELLVNSLIENAKRRGAVVRLPYFGSFNPQELTAPDSPYRSPSRVVVFILSTYLAGKPSPDAEVFLHWLHQVSDAKISDPVPVKKQSVSSDTVAAVRAPESSQKLRTAPLKPEKEATAPSKLRPSLRLTWRRAFGGSTGPTPMASKILNGLQYAVFGVGNSTYRTYNSTAKYVDSKLEELGAVRVCPLGLGDMSKSIDMAFTKWEILLLEQIVGQHRNIPANVPRPTARGIPAEPHRSSLPSVAPVAIDDAILAKQVVTWGSSPVDQHDDQQRRYNSTSAVTSTTHIPVDPRLSSHTQMPVLSPKL